MMQKHAESAWPVSGMILLILCLLVSAADVPAADLTVVPQPLNIPEERFSHLALSSDGKLLYLASEPSDAIVVYDVRRGEVVRTISCPSPVYLLTRGKMLYVACRQPGLVRVIDTSTGQTVRDVQVAEDLLHLAAPRAEAFSGILIASAAQQPRTAASGMDHYVVDTRQGASVGRGSSERLTSVVVDAAGKFVMTRGRSQSHVLYQPFDHFIQGRQSDELQRVLPDISWQPFQNKSDGLWLVGWDVLAGFPPQRIAKLDRTIVAFFDATADNFYTMSRDELAVYDDNPVGPRELGRWPVRHESSNSNWQQQPPFTHPSEPVAATLDGTSYIFYLSASGRAWQMRFPALAPITRNGAGISEGPFPDRLVAGQTLRHRLNLDPQRDEYQLTDGPEGITLTEDGLLVWTPLQSDIGQHELKLRVVIDGRTRFWRFPVEIFPATDDTPGVPLAEVRLGSSRRLILIRSADGGTVIIRQERRVMRLNHEATHVIDQFILEHDYQHVHPLPAGGYVAVRTRPDQLDVLDQTGRITREIPLPHYASDLAVHPRQPLVFLRCAVQLENSSRSVPQVLVLNLSTGRTTAVPRLWPDGFAIDHTGRFLIMHGHSIEDMGLLIDLNLQAVFEVGRRHEMVGRYRIDGTRITPERIVPAEQFVIKRVLLSADGSLAAFDDGSSFQIRRPDALDQVVMQQRTSLGFRDLAFHPRLNLIALAQPVSRPGGGVPTVNIVLLDALTGQPSPELLMQNPPSRDVDKIMFSPCGTGLLATHSTGVSRIPLNLEPVPPQPRPDHRHAEVEAVPTPQPQPTRPQRRELVALRPPPPAQNLTRPELVERYASSVVLIVSGNGTGTGFPVGPRRHILTAAHVLADHDDITVYTPVQRDGQLTTVPTAARLLAIDIEADVALLGLDFQRQLPTAPLALQAPPAGTDVTIIGHPGLGVDILQHTVTSGTVSHSNRIIDGQSYIQTSAAANPGNSGGPIFDSNGRIIGMVVLKAAVPNAAFAVPADRLRALLQQWSDP